MAANVLHLVILQGSLRGWALLENTKLSTLGNHAGIEPLAHGWRGRWVVDKGVAALHSGETAAGVRTVNSQNNGSFESDAEW